ncbi:probable beta-hexosaminidase fdl [Chrysoperla carnea]|uniref:probable beta-hexosaminidase fdl n=1 Tax=Chrysoperla carnea TaxID=189513 RepID=UPI001D095237|nr:probable beta-hexosaminidase fdl [Chrysoperla carnea]
MKDIGTRVCSLAFTFFIIVGSKPLYASSDREVVQPWIWVCTNNHCERRLKTQLDKTDENNEHSFRTCNMLCGSTQLWPQPTGPISLGSISVSFLPKQLYLEADVPFAVLKMVNTAFAIFKTNVRVMSLIKNPYTPDVQKFMVKIKIVKTIQRLKLETSESYTLLIRYSHESIICSIEADTYFGARHGLETLSQLIWWDTELKRLRVLKIANIVDKPKFAYRGLMLDTSRNYFSTKAIKRTLDGMAASKLNAFHWHISDSQSFPFDSPRVPEMIENGVHNRLNVYTAKNIIEISEYARIRGIRVIIEIDTPAHAGMGWTWGPSKGLGELVVCVGQQPSNRYCGEPPCGQLNPQNPHVYKILENLYKDIIELTGETEIFHIGGDEVNLECWNQHQNATSSNTDRFSSYMDLHELWGNFTIKALASLKAANKNKIPTATILWSSNLSKRPYITKYLDPEHIVVQVWSSMSKGEQSKLWNDGYRTILSHVDAWYLDCGFGKWREDGAATCDPYRTWQKVYNHRPWLTSSILERNFKLIVGGEACLWTEQVNEMTLDGRLWPRAASFAERLWSDIPPVDIESLVEIPEDTYTRLDTHRYRLIDRGISAESLWPEWCTYNPGLCF